MQEIQRGHTEENSHRVTVSDESVNECQRKKVKGQRRDRSNNKRFEKQINDQKREDKDRTPKNKKSYFVRHDVIPKQMKKPTNVVMEQRLPRDKKRIRMKPGSLKRMTDYVTLQVQQVDC